MTFLAALTLLSVSIPGLQSCSLPPPPDSWLEGGSGGEQPSVSVRTDSAISDLEMEDFLLNARPHTDMPVLISATTFPMAMDVEWKGEIRKAIFKYRHSESRDPGGSGSGGAGRGSLDSYRHEVAAYRLDRLLDVKMVPVAIIRTLNTEGALIEWISGAFTEQQLRKRGDYPGAPQQLIQQRAVMKLFDALILNVDRKESDQLITPGSWKLHLIDHSRAFGTSGRLPKGFVPQRASLPRSLLQNLENLEKASLEILLDGLVTDAQISAMLRRRDEILKR